MQQVGLAFGFGRASVGPRASPRRVIQEVSSSVHGSSNRWCGVAFTTLSNSSKPKKQGKKLPKQDRRLLVEKFVHKYRTTNSGRFPSAKLTMKEVGGSYYVIRHVIQELEYKYKCLDLDKVDEFQLESMDVQYPEANDKRKAVVEVQHVLSPATEPSISGGKYYIAEDVSLVEEERSSDSSLTAEAKGKEPALGQTYEADLAKGVTDYSSLEDQADHTICDEALRGYPQPEIVVEDTLSAPQKPLACKEIDNGPKMLLGLDNTERKHPCDGQGLKGGKLQRELPMKFDYATEPSVKQKSFWGNLKALAESVMSYWRKM